MALHILKMAAGISSLEELKERQAIIAARRAGRYGAFQPGPGQIVHVTRFFPKRRDEVLATSGAQPGSLFWVFNKRIQARQKIAGFIEVEGRDGRTRCGIVLEGAPLPVERHVRGAFQGWRYLEGRDAPPDLKRGSGDVGRIPAAMRRELEALCLI